VESVAILAALIEEVRLLSVRVEYEDLGEEVEAILVFSDTTEARHYLDNSTEAWICAEDGWVVLPMRLGELPVLCAVSGIGYIAVPMSPGLGQAGVGPVLDVVASLARA
jgi:hypothetical protein